MLFTSETLKHYGLPRSGTNYLKRIIEQNYHVHVLTNEYGWKHGYFVPGFKAVGITKNILAWMWSMHQHLETQSDLVTKDYNHLPFNKFLHAPFKIKRWFWNNDPEPHIHEEHQAETPIHYWHKMNNHWNKHMPVIDYDQLLLHPKQCLNKLKLKEKATWKNCELTMEPGNRISDNTFDRSWYSDQKYLKCYSPKDLEYVNTLLSCLTVQS